MIRAFETPFLTHQSETIGRYLVAKKEIPAKKMIFCEDPIFIYSEFDDMPEDKSVFICYSCFKTSKMSNAVKCDSCQWPACSWPCAHDPVHLKLECAILKDNKVAPTYAAMNNLYLLRCIQMMTKDRQRWDKLMRLTCKMSCSNPTFDHNVDRVSEIGKEFLKRSNIFVPKSTITDIVNRLRINSFVINEVDENLQPVRGYRGVYETSCLIAHSCHPNLEWGVPPPGSPLLNTGERYKIFLYSTKTIQAGEMVTISYTEDYITQGTKQRRINIYNRFGFNCQCERCLDPKELGIGFSSIKCPECPTGYLHPAVVVYEQHTSCQLCSYEMSASKLKNTVYFYHGRLNEILEILDKEERLKELNSFISNQFGDIKFHPNHHLLIRATERWLSTLDLNALLGTTQESYDLLLKIIKRATHLQAIARAFGPTSQLVTLEGFIATSLIKYHFKSKDPMIIEKDVKNTEKKIALIQQIKHHLSCGIHLVNVELYNGDDKAFTKRMEKLYYEWNRRLSECLTKKLKE